MTTGTNTEKPMAKTQHDKIHCNADNDKSLPSDLCVSSSQYAHKLSLTTVTILAILTRFCGLSYPNETVFDEAHTFRFLSRYLAGEYFFDLHPPLGRLMFVALAKLLGWEGGFTPADACEPYDKQNVPYIAMRVLPTLFSCANVSMAYLTAWECGCGVPACLVTAVLMALDTAHIAHTRTVYLDGPLCFFVLSSLYAYIRYSKQKVWSRTWWLWLGLTGLALSCTISTKMVGVFTYTAIGIYTIFELWTLFDVHSGRSVDVMTLYKHVIARLLMLVAIPFSLYLFWFYIHFRLLYKSGTGDNFMSGRFALTLQGNYFSGNRTIPWSFPQKWWELQWTMLAYNDQLGAGETHPYETRPYQWPFPTRGVMFWCSNVLKEQIFFTGNIPGWWIASSSIFAFSFVCIADYLCSARGFELLDTYKRKHLFRVCGFFFVAWLTHYLPLWFMNRQLLLHSYLSAHTISTVLAGSMVELLNASPQMEQESSIRDEVATETGSSAKSATVEELATKNATSYYGSSLRVWTVCWIILVPVFLFWWFWFPLTYGWPRLSAAGAHRREILNIRLPFTYNYSMTDCRQ